jgi:hypothetical protein
VIELRRNECRLGDEVLKGGMEMDEKEGEEDQESW